MLSVGTLIEKLMESPTSAVTETGILLLRILSEDRLSVEAFLEDPLALAGLPYLTPRYLAQVVLRALKDEYETVDEVLASLQSLVDRDPPILEPKRQASPDRVVFPEIKILHYEATAAFIEALVTTGPLKDREISIQVRSSESPTAFSI